MSLAELVTTTSEKLARVVMPRQHARTVSGLHRRASTGQRPDAYEPSNFVRYLRANERLWLKRLTKGSAVISILDVPIRPYHFNGLLVRAHLPERGRCGFSLQDCRTSSRRCSGVVTLINECITDAKLEEVKVTCRNPEALIIQRA
jgi:hypothetical protein